MYNFAKQKDMNEMLEEFENLCEDTEDIELGNGKIVTEYDCNSELGIVLYYLDGEAVAVLYDDETLIFLDVFDSLTQVRLIENIIYELGKKLYVEFDSDEKNFANDINTHMYSKHDYIKEQGISIEEQEELDLKEWKKEEARQAYAMNRGML